MMQSKKWKVWISKTDNKTCKPCYEYHGAVISPEEETHYLLPVHLNCRCSIEWMQALLAGTATNKGLSGADYWLKKFYILPDYYIDANKAKQLGWKPSKGNLADVASGKMLYKGVYKNVNKKLPQAPGRVWFEADINYTQGWRGMERIIYSNDGLIFVSYNHYDTFWEVV